MSRILSDDAARLLGNTTGEHVFRVEDGRVLQNTRELREALEAMTDETYFYHANAMKNDFANWVRDIVADRKLANDLVKAAGRKQAARAVAARIYFLNGKLGPGQPA